MDLVVQALTPVTPPRRPALLRVATGAYTLWYLARRVRLLRGVHRTDPALFDPVGPVRLLSRPLPPLVADSVAAATLVTTGLFTAGVAHRLVGPLHSGLLLWTLSYRNSWSMVFHSDNALVLHTVALGLTPSADAASVSALLRQVPGGRDDRAGDAAGHWRYGTAGTAMNLGTAAVYLLSGVAKVAGPLGWRWADGASLRSQVEADALRKDVLRAGGGAPAARLRHHRLLFTAMASGSLALELLAPLALFDRRVGRAWSAATFGMHWGIKAVMGITFRHQMSGVMYLPHVLRGR
ncbi:hypothetical protein [Aquipuribacter sp. MA13-6]|uniref:hypothetical protein n=1 Tax=unclassified Aquipuribacter TaxID=2635084 RepID=UPI003EEF10DC